MTERKLYAKRDSVCAGDDCTAPNGETLSFKSGIMLSELMNVVAKYVPKFSDKQHTIWGIECDGKLIAFLESSGSGAYKGFLAVEDTLADVMQEKEIYCRYFFDFQGNLSSNLNAVSDMDSKNKRLGANGLLGIVKAYYELPVDKRWGWF